MSFPSVVAERSIAGLVVIFCVCSLQQVEAFFRPVVFIPGNTHKPCNLHSLSFQNPPLSLSLASNIYNDHELIVGSDHLNDWNNWEQELLQTCRSATTRSTNPTKSPRIDAILQKLNGPAPQSFFVLQRAVQRATQTSTTTAIISNHQFNMLRMTASFLVKRGFKLLVICDCDGVLLPPDQHNDASDDPAVFLSWDIVPDNQVDNNTNKFSREIKIFEISNRHQPWPSTLQLANQALDIVTDASEHQVLLSREPIDKLVQQALEQLSWTCGMDLRGRTSADAAFVFALAGVVDPIIFQQLACISHYELQRVGKRPSFYSKYVLQIVEKHAAAGTKGLAVQELYHVAADCLHCKGEHSHVVKQLLLPSTIVQQRNVVDTSTTPLDVVSPRPLLWLWRFSAGQKKAKPTDSVLSSEEDIVATIKSGLSSCTSNRERGQLSGPYFANPQQPLIIDLGCGMGTSLLGLASTTNDNDACSAALSVNFNWENCNFLGADLSQLALNFAQGIATRWNLTERLQYVWATAESCLDMVEDTYEGPIALIMIQFPTPYRLESTSSDDDNDRIPDGNSQLPADASSGFMVSDDLMERVARILAKSGGELLFQSNCEDVAVTMRRRATEKHGMKPVKNLPKEVMSAEDMRQPTLRDMLWAKLGGERAIGPGWSSIPLLPPRGVTETEVACQLHGTPVHRCLLSAS